MPGCLFFFRVHPYNSRPVHRLLSWKSQVKYKNTCNSAEDVYFPHNLPAEVQLLQSDGTFYCPFKGKLHVKYTQTPNPTTLPAGQNIVYTYSLSYNNVTFANHRLDENNSYIQYDTVLSVDTGDVLKFSVSSNDIWENMHLNPWHPNVYYDSVFIENVLTNVLEWEEGGSDTTKYFDFYPVPEYDLPDQLFSCFYASTGNGGNNGTTSNSTTLTAELIFNGVVTGNYTLYLIGDQGVLYRCTGHVNSTNISETVQIPVGYSGNLWIECVMEASSSVSLNSAKIDGTNCNAAVYHKGRNVSHLLYPEFPDVS